jgi:hypothetical protein
MTGRYCVDDKVMEDLGNAVDDFCNANCWRSFHENVEDKLLKMNRREYKDNSGQIYAVSYTCT